MRHKVLRSFSKKRRELLEWSVLGGASLSLGVMGGIDAKASECSSDCQHPIVATTSGKVRGRMVQGINIFKGIPYGDSTAGVNRFLSPRKPKPWTEVRDAFHNGPLAMQSVPVSGPFSQEEVLAINKGAVPNWQQEKRSEECLVLNVWTPAVGDGNKRPVMFHCHGGGFSHGTGVTGWTDGSHLARKNDVVVVSMNHRLNIFGFLYLAEIGGEKYADSGNVGMLDIVAALEWVRDNIASFGGDSDNVTIFGESGGGSKVSVLMAMPSARGLFHKAIVESGPGLRMLSRERGTYAAHRVLAQLGLQPRQVDELQKLPAEKILNAMDAVLARESPAIRRWDAGGFYSLFAPVVDGRSLPVHPFHPVAPEQSADIPMLIGTAADEMHLILGGADQSLFSLNEAELHDRLRPMGIDRAEAEHLIRAYRTTRPNASASDIFFAIASDATFRMDAIAKAERKAAQNRAPVYMYLFAWEIPSFGGKYKSSHGAELPFVFDTLDNAPGMVGSDPRRYPLAEKMSRAYVAFARTGNPHHAGLPAWNPYSIGERATMVFNYRCELVNDPRREDRMAWKS